MLHIHIYQTIDMYLVLSHFFLICDQTASRVISYRTARQIGLPRRVRWKQRCGDGSSGDDGGEQWHFQCKPEE